MIGAWFRALFNVSLLLTRQIAGGLLQLFCPPACSPPAAMQQPVQVVMQPLQPPSSSQQPASVPLRWAEAIRNVDSAQRTLEDLARQLDSALYLDEEAWRQAVPHAQFSAALQVSSGRWEAGGTCGVHGAAGQAA